jgi:hypothetical protein
MPFSAPKSLLHAGAIGMMENAGDPRNALALAKKQGIIDAMGLTCGRPVRLQSACRGPYLRPT